MWPRSPATPNRIDASSVGPHIGLDLPTVTWAPLKSLRRIRLITPPTASAPEIAEAPSVRTSLRSTAASGTALRSVPEPAANGPRYGERGVGDGGVRTGRDR